MYTTVDLHEGQDLMIKRMEGSDGSAFPRHSASHESALVVIEGSCTFILGDESRTLHAGDTMIVPAHDVHQVIAAPAFKAIHVLPMGIRFNFKV